MPVVMSSWHQTMNNKQLARRLSEQTGVSTAEAADGLESVVTRILEKLRKGKRAPLGKLGVFQPGQVPAFEFKKPTAKAGK